MSAQASTNSSTGQAEAVRGATIGVVESDKRDKTRRVVVRSVTKTGDTVEVIPCVRLSKTKSWKLVRIVSRPAGA